MVKAVPVCGEETAACSCFRSCDHEGPHECRCSGSWEWVDGKFQVIAFPDTAWATGQLEDSE